MATAEPWQEFDRGQLDINAVNNQLALPLFALTANKIRPGSESLAQELTNRMPPGLRRKFRSYLHALLPGQTLAGNSPFEGTTPPIFKGR